MKFDTNSTINATTNSTITDDPSSPSSLKILIWGQFAITMTSFTLNLVSLYCYKRGISGAKRLSRASFSIFGGGVLSTGATTLNFINGSTEATYVLSSIGGAALGSIIGFFAEKYWRKDCCGNNPRQVAPAPQ